MFCKKGVLKNFANFTGKHLCRSLFLRPVTLLKRDCNTGVFLWNLAKFLRTPFFTEHLRLQLLEIYFLIIKATSRNSFDVSWKTVTCEIIDTYFPKCSCFHVFLLAYFFTTLIFQCFEIWMLLHRISNEIFLG